MTTLMLTFLLFAVVVGLMSVLVELSGRPIKGSCGGVGGGSCACKDQDLPRGSCGEVLDPARAGSCGWRPSASGTSAPRGNPS